MSVYKSKFWTITKGRIGRKAKENVFNSFGKGTDMSVALNFGSSSGPNCWVGCRHHQQSTADNPTYACYSTTSEKMRPTVRQSLVDKEAGSPLAFLALAYQQLQDLYRFLDSRGLELDWLRISAAGSVPSPEQIPEHERKRFENILRMMVRLCVEKGTKIHFPVESVEKQQYYSSIVRDLATVRLSLQDSDSELSNTTPCSFVVGKEITSRNSRSVRKDRVSLARSRARERYLATGRKTIVCPAITSTWAKGRKIRCGECPACGNEDIDVIYPLHV